MAKPGPLLLLLICGSIAHAQSEAPQPSSAPAPEAVHSESAEPAQLDRALVPFAKPAEVDTVNPTSGVVTPASPQEESPTAQRSVPAAITPLTASSARPLLHYGQPSGFNVELTGSLRASFTGLQPFATDRDGTQLSPTPFETRVRLAPVVRYSNLSLVGEVDVVTGALAGLPGEELRLGASAHPAMAPMDLRQLYLEYRGPTFSVRGGQQTSHWGLGMVANNGAQDTAPGEFGDAHYGDLTYRAALAGRPLYSLGGPFRAIEPIIAVDLVVRDDTADYRKGDRALQGVMALRFNVDPDRNFGVYAVYRQQRADGVTDGGRSTDAFIVDASGRWRWANDRRDSERKLAFEAAFITGKTTLIRSDTAPSLDLQQFGAAVKGSVRLRSWEGYMDVGYASGDQNPYDDRLDSFRFDPDYRAGLILFQEVMGWQSARTWARATDPAIIGFPPEGSDLLPTRGAITGAAYLFPRVRKGLREWLDVYGGPLFAVTTASMVDAFNTRVAGGTPRNALDGTPGRYLGTEIDLGLQARMKPVRGMGLTATVEAGYFVPGAAFTMADGTTLPPVAAARLRVGASF